MLKHVKRYVRERFEKKVISKPEKVDSIRKPGPTCYCKYNTSLFPNYLRKVNQNFNSQFVVLRHCDEQQGNESSTKYKTAKCLNTNWIETVGLSGTFAFGWSLSQNIDLKRKRLVEEILSLHFSESYPLTRSLCPYIAFKNALPKPVQTQPHESLSSKYHDDSNDVGDKITLPVFGPLTAEDTLNEAKRGLEKARNAAIAELENRMGLRCMSKRRYRRAMIHFAAGSALQNGSATFNLAQCYELGLGTPKDLAKAAKCYVASSELGNATATFNLAVYYAQGLGGLKSNTQKARELLEKAVELGEPHAKAALENRFERKQSSTKESDGKNPLSPVNLMKKPAVNEKLTRFSEIDVDKVTETSMSESVPVTTEKYAVIAEKAEKCFSEISLLQVRGCTSDKPKMLVNFDDQPTLQRQDLKCSIPLTIPLCANKINAVQGQ